MVIVVKKKMSKAKLKEALKRAKPVKRKGFDAQRHLGKWKLDQDALTTQRQLRNEWE